MGAGTYLISNFLGEVSLAWEVTVGVLIVSVTSPYRRRGLLSPQYMYCLQRGLAHSSLLIAVSLGTCTLPISDFRKSLLTLTSG